MRASLSADDISGLEKLLYLRRASKGVNNYEYTTCKNYYTLSLKCDSGSVRRISCNRLWKPPCCRRRVNIGQTHILLLFLFLLLIAHSKSSSNSSVSLSLSIATYSEPLPTRYCERTDATQRIAVQRNATQRNVLRHIVNPPLEYVFCDVKWLTFVKFCAF